MWIKRQKKKNIYIFQMLSYLNTLDVAPPFESMLNPFCCRGFLRVVHHHKRLMFLCRFLFFIGTSLCNKHSRAAASFESHDLHDVSLLLKQHHFRFGEIIVNIAIYGLNWRRRAKKREKKIHVKSYVLFMKNKWT